MPATPWKRPRTTLRHPSSRVVLAYGALALLLVSCAHLKPRANITLLGKEGVFAEPVALPRMSSLRVGVPGGGRACLVFPCPAVRVAPPLAAQGYRLETGAPGEHRLLRSITLADTVPWPDTLFVRTFRDVVDQEIALERGEIDVAVFWPGELSSRMRTGERWRDFARGTLARGVLAAVGGDSTQAAGMAPLNERLFAGDLLEWSALTGTSAPAPGAATRYSVDAAMPARALIERVLARGVPAGSAATSARFAWLPVMLADRDSLAVAWRAHGTWPLFALRCPVVATPAYRLLVAKLGADAFANLVECTP